MSQLDKELRKRLETLEDNELKNLITKSLDEKLDFYNEGVKLRNYTFQQDHDRKELQKQIKTLNYMMEEYQRYAGYGKKYKKLLDTIDENESIKSAWERFCLSLKLVEENQMKDVEFVKNNRHAGEIENIKQKLEEQIEEKWLAEFKRFKEESQKTYQSNVKSLSDDYYKELEKYSKHAENGLKFKAIIDAIEKSEQLQKIWEQLVKELPEEAKPFDKNLEKNSDEMVDSEVDVHFVYDDLPDEILETLPAIRENVIAFDKELKKKSSKPTNVPEQRQQIRSFADDMEKKAR